jgi:hypothetical protein
METNLPAAEPPAGPILRINPGGTATNGQKSDIDLLKQPFVLSRYSRGRHSGTSNDEQ